MFPFAAAREEGIKKGLKSESIPPRIPDESEDVKRKRHDAMIKASRSSKPEPIPQFQTRAERIAKYGKTPDCAACQLFPYHYSMPHTPECRRKFYYALKDAGLKFYSRKPADGAVVEEIQDGPDEGVFPAEGSSSSSSSSSSSGAIRPPSARPSPPVAEPEVQPEVEEFDLGEFDAVPKSAARANAGPVRPGERRPRPKDNAQ